MASMSADDDPSERTREDCVLNGRSSQTWGIFSGVTLHVPTRQSPQARCRGNFSRKHVRQINATNVHGIREAESRTPCHDKDSHLVDSNEWNGISRESQYHDVANSARNCKPTLWRRALSARGEPQSHPLAGQAQACGRLTQAEGPEDPIAPVGTSGSHKKDALTNTLEHGRATWQQDIGVKILEVLGCQLSFWSIEPVMFLFRKDFCALRVRPHAWYSSPKNKTRRGASYPRRETCKLV